MERKVLWLISFAVIFILWLKIDPVENSENTAPSASVSKSAPARPAVKPQNKGDALADKKEAGPTKEEQEYFDSHPISSDTPDFAAITDVKARKQAFFEFLAPFVEEKNELLLRDRATLEKMIVSSEPPTREEKRWLKALRQLHNLKDVGVYLPKDIKEILPFVDVIPTSMVLAQAANESAWGTSRFAVEGNNYFGQWCFRKGCGLVPSSREEDADHEVRKFNDARESVFAYIDNLNSFAAYKELRQIRAELRENGEQVTGLKLVHGLENYSERGQEYIDEIEALIEYNKLWRFNTYVTDNQTTLDLSDEESKDH